MVCSLSIVLGISLVSSSSSFSWLQPPSRSACKIIAFDAKTSHAKNGNLKPSKIKQLEKWCKVYRAEGLTCVFSHGCSGFLDDAPSIGSASGEWYVGKRTQLVWECFHHGTARQAFPLQEVDPQSCSPPPGSTTDWSSSCPYHWYSIYYYLLRSKLVRMGEHGRITRSIEWAVCAHFLLACRHSKKFTYYLCWKIKFSIWKLVRLLIGAEPLVKIYY